MTLDIDTNAITDRIARTQSSPFLKADDDEAKRIRSVIAATLANGKDAAYVRGELMKFIDNPERIEDIIYTELNFAVSAGIITFGQESGAVAKEWDSLPRCCDECSKLNGKKVKPGSAFSRHDSIGHPPLHSRCGCGVFLHY